MEKLPGWKQGLYAHFKANERRAFNWGGWDCCSGIYGPCCEIMYGFNPIEQHLGKYSTEDEAFARLREIEGVNSPVELVNKRFGPPSHPSFTQSGDFVHMYGCIGIAYHGNAVFIGEEHFNGWSFKEGLVHVPLKDVEACWRV